MARFNVLLVLIGIVILSTFAFALGAGCSEKAFRNACANCKFDANGQIDQSCSGGYRASGISCVSAAYPIMSTKYAAGQCAAVDSCASELQSCVAQVGGGSDKANCEEGSVETCYAASDACVQTAAKDCGEFEGQTCGGSSAALILVGLCLAFVKIKR